MPRALAPYIRRSTALLIQDSGESTKGADATQAIEAVAQLTTSKALLKQKPGGRSPASNETITRHAAVTGR